MVQFLSDETLSDFPVLQPAVQSPSRPYAVFINFYLKSNLHNSKSGKRRRQERSPLTLISKPQFQRGAKPQPMRRTTTYLHFLERDRRRLESNSREGGREGGTWTAKERELKFDALWKDGRDARADGGESTSHNKCRREGREEKNGKGCDSCVVTSSLLPCHEIYRNAC